MNNETQNIEYKESWRDEYLQWICGMANSIGGTMFIGVNDKGEVAGVQKVKKLFEDIPNKVKDTMGVIVNCLPHEKDGKEYLEITVPQTAYAVSYRGHFYYRSGATNLELAYGMLHTFLLNKNGMNWEDMPVSGVTLNDLDRDSFKIFRREALRHKRMSKEELDMMDNEELLSKLRLYTGDGQLKRAAILLFHEDPERWFTGAYIKIGRFTGSEIRYQDELHGSLMRQADQITDLVYTKYLIADISYDNITRVETYPYSKEGFREGIFNAIMHKAYETDNTIQVRIEDDRMFISNDVSFDNKWTPELLMAPHRSEPHNPTIAQTFFRAGYVEAWGRGIGKMCDACKAWGQPMPEYIADPGGLRLLFHALSTSREMLIGGGKKSGKETADGGKKGGLETTIGGKKIMEIDPNGDPKTLISGKKTTEGNQNGGPKTSVGSKNIDDGEYAFFVGLKKYNIQINSTLGAIITLLIGNPYATMAIMTKEIGINRSALQKNLEKLKDYGILKRIGPDKGGHWECIEPENDTKKGGTQ